MTRKIEHYLITIPGDPVNVHAYVMTNDKQALQAVMHEMIDHTEKRFGRIRIPMGLSTILADDGRELVRNFLLENSPEVRRLLAEATDFHRTVWEMPAGDPMDERLMELH